MKQFIAPSYTFTPGSSGVGTVNLSGISGFNIKYLVAVINQTRGVVIYSTADASSRYTNLTGTTLTLNVDTSTHNSGDVLQVIYEVTDANPLTDTQLRAASVPVSGTFFQATQPVSAASLPLPSGAATETTLVAVEVDTSSIATSTSSINTKIPALGQTTMAGSTPVVIASNQAAFPVSSTPPSPTLSSYSQAGVIAINTILLSVDCTQARFLSIQCTSMGTTGVITPEWSNDNVTWVTSQTVSSATGAAITTFTAAILATTAVYARYFRLRLSTATTGGTTTLSVQQFDFFGSPTTQATSITTLPSLAVGSNLIGDVGIQYRALGSGAASFVSVQSPATPAVATIKASATRLIGYYLQNSATTLRSVKIFNATAPTLGTTAASFEIDIPANGISQLHFEGGLSFLTASTYSVTSAKGLTDNTATGLALNDVSGFIAFA